MARQLLGQPVADTIIAKLKAHCQQGLRLVIVQIGNHHASDVFIKKKQEMAESLGWFCKVQRFSQNTQAAQLKAALETLNTDNHVHGIIVQLPVPEHLNPWQLCQHISPRKDVDCLTASNMGRFMQGLPGVIPGTAAAIAALCQHYQIMLRHKKVCLIGASILVGQAIAIWLLQQGATVTISHHDTLSLASCVQGADMIISATGKSGLLRPEWLNHQPIVLDLGIRLENGKTVGDIEPELSQFTSMITPVPGGLGPITVAILMAQLQQLAERS